MKKGNAILTMTVAFIGIFIAVTLVGNLVLTTTFTPLAPVPTTVTNSTALTSLNATTFKNHQYATSNIDNTYASTLTVTFAGASNVATVTVNGVSVGNLTTSPTTLTVPLTITLTNPVIVNYTTTVTPYIGAFNATNITSAVLTYNQKGAYYGYDSGTQSMWLVLPIALVAMLLLFIFKRD